VDATTTCFCRKWRARALRIMRTASARTTMRRNFAFGTSGHPADSGGRHYSWYFLPTLNLYYNAFEARAKYALRVWLSFRRRLSIVAIHRAAFAWAKE